MKRFVVAAFHFPDLTDINQRVDKLELVFTAIGEDWIRFNAFMWILWTDKPLPHILTLLSPHVTPAEQVFLGDMAENFFGFCQPWIWNWMNEKRPDWTKLTSEQAQAAARLPVEFYKNRSE